MINEPSGGNKAVKLKYKFIPVETHQMMDFNDKKTEEEFK